MCHLPPNSVNIGQVVLHNPSNEQTNADKNIYLLGGGNEKSAQRSRNHCALAIVRQSQKFLPRHRPRSRGAG